MTTRLLVAVALLALPSSLFAQEKKGPTAQYEFEKIVVPLPTADEAKLKEISIEKASKYLDEGTHAWNGHRKCVACHTNGIYMTVRPALAPYLGPADPKVRDHFVATLKSKKSGPRSNLITSTNPAQMIYLAAGLADWDAATTGKLSAETDEALKLMLEIQKEGGTWGSLDCWPPYESDAYHLATVAAMAVATAPGWLDQQKDATVLASVESLKKYLRETPPLHDYSRVLLLWAATRMKGLIDDKQQSALTEMLVKKQKADGGWSIRDFASPEQWGKGNRADKLKAEPEFKAPPSDGHMTGLAIVVLRARGVAKNDAGLTKGIAWIKSNQRESGRWWTRSLNTDTYHFITYSGTAFPVWALAVCDELPKVGTASTAGK
jgi:squalene-hopene/tetraprenyl-beta-curcumene cyclase